MDRSPLAPDRFPDLPPVAGVRVAVARARYKAWERADLTLAVFAGGAAVAGLTTRSKCPSPEVEHCRRALAAGGTARALVVNAGNANAFTGVAGEAAVRMLTGAVAAELGCAPDQVFAASTGVIGVPLPQDKARAGLEGAFAKLRVGSDATWEHAAGAIGTTDTFPKGVGRTLEIDGRAYSIVGIAKGSGMIAPDMATMLAFVFTDAPVAAPALQAMLTRAADVSFHAITVDGDTSTSDTLLAFATGAAGGAELGEHRAFAAALTEVCRELALQIVRDGEGAQKLIEVRVTGAEDDRAAKRIAMSIANSPLVKTAIAGEDANWGRVVMAVGKAGEAADRDRLSIRFGGVEVAARGMVVPGYDEAPVAAHLKGRDVLVEVDLDLGDGRATVWTCDLTHGYISINADYRS
ncbi:MAG: bifunctional glutamate N-acetyltransferase/amino-acid acetyltransferase ArgJ [Sphingomonadaceae bacterium]|nr:bifunctional glutamate N-acetyltransferase/amino-acid acetyltransferase ArgJ [Sphingomonadaceae bacterium]